MIHAIRLHAAKTLFVETANALVLQNTRKEMATKVVDQNV